MTVAFHDHECWTVAEGSPIGVRFDITVPSATNPGRPFRIVRQEPSIGVEGYIVHTPACRAWREGKRMCTHVQRALETAEDPLRRFAIDVVEAWNFKGISLEDFRDYSAAIYQSAQQAIAQADDNDRYEERREEYTAALRRTQAEQDALTDQAILEFGGASWLTGGVR
jgi:hypothetical protein